MTMKPVKSPKNARFDGKKFNRQKDRIDDLLKERGMRIEFHTVYPDTETFHVTLYKNRYNTLSTDVELNNANAFAHGFIIALMACRQKEDTT